MSQPSTSSRLLPIVAAVPSALAMWVHGFNGSLLRDHAVFFLGGRQWLDGLPPYLGIWDHKGPLVFLPCAVGVGLGRLSGLDELLATRLLFSLFACATASLLYLLCLEILQSRRASLLASALLPCFTLFVVQASSGPNSKILAVFLQVLTLLLCVRGRWFWAGAAGMSGILVWQPNATFLLAALLSACLVERTTRARALAALAPGAVLPLALFALYFSLVGALGPMMDATFFFQLLDLWRPESTRATWVPACLTMTYRAFPTMFLPILLGLASTLLLGALRFRNARAGASFARDPLLPMLLALPLPILFSLIDFQGGADFFVFLPYCCLGLGWFLHRSLPPSLPSLPATAGLLLILLFQSSFSASISRDEGLHSQREVAGALGQELHEGARLLSLGAPQLLALLQRENPNRHPFIISGIDRWMDRQLEGGFQSFIDDVAAYDPDWIALGPTRGPLVLPLLTWVDANYQQDPRFEFAAFKIMTRRESPLTPPADPQSGLPKQEKDQEK